MFESVSGVNSGGVVGFVTAAECLMVAAALPWFVIGYKAVMGAGAKAKLVKTCLAKQEVY
ncbi:MAG: hypothetical protein IPN68_14380 [Bacteroidetes bacterium]|nr:hypothetical protein [Bacteroidota bacterium]